MTAPIDFELDDQYVHAATANEASTDGKQCGTLRNH